MIIESVPSPPNYFLKLPQSWVCCVGMHLPRRLRLESGCYSIMSGAGLGRVGEGTQQTSQEHFLQHQFLFLVVVSILQQFFCPSKATTSI